MWIQFEYAPKMSLGTPGEGGCSWQNPISAESVSSRGFPTKDWALKMAWSITQEEIETIKIIFLYYKGSRQILVSGFFVKLVADL